MLSRFMPDLRAFADWQTQKELSTFVENEQAQQRLNSSIHTFTDMCWDKCVYLIVFMDPTFDPGMSRCVTGIPSTRFSRSEESCLANCVNRFLDSSLFLVKKIEEQREASRG